LFPVRYYINDFEFAVTFDPHSEPSSRTLTGLPTTGIRTGEYGREPAPEMLSGTPYCPFRADIWQLGTMFNSRFGVRVRSQLFPPLLQLSSSQHLRHLSEPLVDLFDTMCSEDPSSRPSASEALECVRRLVHSHDILMSDVPWPAPVPFKPLLRTSKEATEETPQ
jgi:serine/threonine protein kinase